MSFLEENKNFFRNLYSEFKNLDPVSKHEKYESFKDQIKRRTSEYYQKIERPDNEQKLLNEDFFFNNLIECIEHYDADEEQRLLKKDRFYKDLIEWIGHYDFNYILMNLFLDNDFLKLISSFYTNEDFKSLLERSKTPLAFFIKGFSRKLNRSFSVDKEFSAYLKKAFYDFIPSNDNTWVEKDFKKDSSVSHKYGQYLINSIIQDFPYWDSIIHNHLLFIKAYNHLDYYKNDRNLKSIILINELIVHYKLESKQNDVKLAELLTRIDSKIHTHCFVKYFKTPVCMSTSEAYSLSSGLANRIKEFDDLFNIRRVVVKNEQSTYNDLFQLSNRITLEELNTFLEKKIKAGQLITKEDIKGIIDYPDPNTSKAKQLILKKFYLYENLHY